MNPENKKGENLKLLPAIILYILAGALIGWIIGIVVWFVFAIFSPIHIFPPLLYQVAWAVFGAIGFPILKGK